MLLGRVNCPVTRVTSQNWSTDVHQTVRPSVSALADVSLLISSPLGLSGRGQRSCSREGGASSQPQAFTGSKCVEGVETSFFNRAALLAQSAHIDPVPRLQSIIGTLRSPPFSFQTFSSDRVSVTSPQDCFCSVNMHKRRQAASAVLSL